MDLNLLSVFVKVADKGSFTKAAEALRQPKSRVSRNISALEREVGSPLIYRSTRQVSLTEVGRSLYEQVREYVYGLEGATEGLHAASDRVAGLLKLTAAEDFGVALLGHFISGLTKHYPDLRVQLHFSNDYVDLVKEGIDLAIRIGELEDTALMAKKIGSIAFILVATPGYLKKAAPIKALDDLGHHPLLSFVPIEVDGAWVLVGDRKERKLRIKPVCSANNPKVLFDIVLDHRGVALLPEFLCAEKIQQKLLTRILPTYSTAASPVHFVWPSQKENNPKLRAFIEYSEKYFTPFLK